MFGVLKPDLRRMGPEDRDAYRRVYCGVCGQMSRRFGYSRRMLLVNDVVTLGWLTLTDLGSNPKANCARFWASRECEDPQAAQALAALSVLMIQIKAEDDQNDGDRPLSATRWLWGGTVEAASEALDAAGFPLRRLREVLAWSKRGECSDAQDFTKWAAPTEHAYALTMADLARRSGVVSTQDAVRMGGYLGRMVLLIDAVSDLDQDRRDRRMNPLHGVEPSQMIDHLNQWAAPPQLSRDLNPHVQSRFLATCASLGHRLQEEAEKLPAQFRPSLVKHVTLNLVCCIPCGDGAVGLDSNDIGGMCGGALCCCGICYFCC